MRQNRSAAPANSGPEKEPAEQIVKDIRRATRRQFSAEEKIRIVLEGVRGDIPGAERRSAASEPDRQPEPRGADSRRCPG